MKFLLTLALVLMVRLGFSTTAFTFTLDYPCNTSAGVYAPDGSLVRTLWSKTTYYAAGTYSTNWNNLDDFGNTCTNGNYLIKADCSNLGYVQLLPIGNTSSDLFGYTIHRGYGIFDGLAINGLNGAYVSGYNESMFGMRQFNTSNPNRLTACVNYVGDQFNALRDWPGQANRYWRFIKMDSSRIYYATVNGYSASNNATFGGPGFFQIIDTTNHTLVNISSGILITNNLEYFTNGVYIGTQPGAGGLAVQTAGTILAASVAPDNKVYLFDKTSGAALGNFAVNSPGRMDFDLTGSNLWICRTNSVDCYTNLLGTPAVRVSISVTNPLDVAANFTNANLIGIVDGGNKSQIRFYDTNGTSPTLFGTLGGYSTSPTVTNTKWCFTNYSADIGFGGGGAGFSDGGITADGSDGFWVGDIGNNRWLHFDKNQNFIEQIMYQPKSYCVSVDKANPARIFNQFYEFAFDPTKAPGQNWYLTNNWFASADTNHFISGGGLYDVETFPNGRTYALVANNTNSAAGRVLEMAELTSTGLRFTGIFPGITNGFSVNNSFTTNGAVIASYVAGNTNWLSSVTGYDGSNNPQYGTPSIIASAPSTGMNPRNQNTAIKHNTPLTLNGKLVVFDDSKNTNAHVGLIPYGSNNFIARINFGSNYFNGLGDYEISNNLNFAGSDVAAFDRHIVTGFKGENFRTTGQASQQTHFYDDGLFLGQFGESAVGYGAGYGAPSFTGNLIGPAITKTNNQYYIFENDESGHGLEVIQLLNASNVRELTNTIALNGSGSLVTPTATFPVVSAVPGNKLASLSWTAVPLASLYSVYRATNSGGPYVLVGNYNDTNATVYGLSNGTNYYFTVSGNVGISSEEIKMQPFDTTQNSVFSGYQINNLSVNNINYNINNYGIFNGNVVLNVDSNAPALGLPSLLNEIHPANFFSPSDMGNMGAGRFLNESIGRQGYWIANWLGSGIHVTNISGGVITIGAQSGWSVNTLMQRVAFINGTTNFTSGGGQNTHFALGNIPNSTGSIAINISDSLYHTITAVLPSYSSGSNSWTLTMTPASGSASSFTVSDSTAPIPTTGVNNERMAQFVVKGNQTLTMTGGSAGKGALMGLFFDGVTNATGSVVNVADYGAVGNQVFLAGLTTTSNSPTVTLTTASGTQNGTYTNIVASSANLGQTLEVWSAGIRYPGVNVYGYGTTNEVLRGIVTNVVDSTHVQIDRLAGWTGPGMTGIMGTNNQVAISNAIVLGCVGTNDVLYIPTGTFFCADPNLIAGNTNGSGADNSYSKYGCFVLPKGLKIIGDGTNNSILSFNAGWWDVGALAWRGSAFQFFGGMTNNTRQEFNNVAIVGAFPQGFAADTGDSSPQGNPDPMTGRGIDTTHVAGVVGGAGGGNVDTNYIFNSCYFAHWQGEMFKDTTGLTYLYTQSTNTVWQDGNLTAINNFAGVTVGGACLDVEGGFEQYIGGQTLPTIVSGVLFSNVTVATAIVGATIGQVIPSTTITGNTMYGYLKSAIQLSYCGNVTIQSNTIYSMSGKSWAGISFTATGAQGNLGYNTNINVSYNTFSYLGVPNNITPFSYGLGSYGVRITNNIAPQGNLYFWHGFSINDVQDSPILSGNIGGFVDSSTQTGKYYPLVLTNNNFSLLFGQDGTTFAAGETNGFFYYYGSSNRVASATATSGAFMQESSLIPTNAIAIISNPSVVNLPVYQSSAKTGTPAVAPASGLLYEYWHPEVSAWSTNSAFISVTNGYAATIYGTFTGKINF